MRHLKSYTVAVLALTLPTLALTGLVGENGPAGGAGSAAHATRGGPVRMQPRREDTRTGTVVDRQGMALVRPVGRERWSPVRQKTILMPGDQLRTPLRGANAVEVRLAGGGSLVLGPGGLIELVQRGELRLYRGEIEVKAEAKPVQLAGPGGFKQTVAKKKVLVVRARNRAKDRVDAEIGDPDALLGHAAQLDQLGAREG